MCCIPSIVKVLFLAADGISLTIVFPLLVDAGLSLLEYPGLKATDPAYALPVDVVDRIFFGR